VAASGWPGERGLSASEFEATRAWESVLDTVATLDVGGRRVALAIALEALDAEVRDASLKLPSTDAPVKVMNVSEAEGSFFDAVVLMQATDRDWPGGTKIHPLLPWAMQRTFKMSGSDAALSAARDRSSMETLLRAAGPVLFTHAIEDSSGALRASPLLSVLGIEPVSIEQVALYHPKTLEIEYETVADAGSLPELPSPEVGGGSSVLKLQAACGFLAFAELRLRARVPEVGDLGMDAGETGSLLHRALQSFWRETKSQAALRAMSATELEESVMRAVDSAFAKGMRPRSEWDRSYLWIQRQRLRTLLRQWLPHELMRGPFTVADVERKELMHIGPLTLDVRVDRVDSVPGGVFFVDYKTGYDVAPKQWEGPRPDDPQLPMYALLAEGEELKGVAFGRVRAGREMSWVGYQAEEGILPASRSKSNVKEMTSLAAEWREMLEELAHAFAKGVADVAPKSFDKNCARCAQRLICRVNPETLAQRDEEEDVIGEDEVG
jgi:probable DNA repair protein